MTSTDILLAGAIAAFTVDLLIYPLDTLKTRLQNKSPGTAAARKTFWKNPQHYKGLYQGVGSVVIATAPASGVFFTTYEFLLSHTHSAVISSSIAEACSCAIITPAEVIKQNAQVLVSPRLPHTPTSPQPHVARSTLGGIGINSSSLQALRRIPKFTHLWRGYTTLVGRNLPFTAMQFPVFEAMKRRILDKDCGPLRTGVGAGVSAGAAGCVAAVITTPVDVVKTRVMLSAGQDNGKSVGSVGVKKGWNGESAAGAIKSCGEKKGAREVMKEVLREEGWRGLMRGGALRGAWTAVGSGLYLGSYEAAKVWLKEGREQKERERVTD